MVAKNSPKSATSSRADHAQPDIREIFALHLQASKRRDELREQADELQRAGKIREARKLRAQAQQIQERLTALEAECRQPNPHDQGN